MENDNEKLQHIQWIQKTWDIAQESYEYTVMMFSPFGSFTVAVAAMWINNVKFRHTREIKMIINLEYSKRYSSETNVFGTSVCCLRFYNIQSVLCTM